MRRPREGGADIKTKQAVYTLSQGYGPTSAGAPLIGIGAVPMEPLPE
jgi:hypothetical protein